MWRGVITFQSWHDDNNDEIRQKGVSLEVLHLLLTITTVMILTLTNSDKDIDNGGHGDEDDEHYNNDVGQLPWQTMLKSAQGGSFQLLDCPISPI